MREHVKEIGSSSARIQVIEAKGGFFAASAGAESDAARESKESEAPANRNAERVMSH